MASLEESLVTLLRGSTGITGLVGSGSDVRIYALLVPQGKPYPAITYQVISQEREPELTKQNGLFKARVQINCWDTSYEGARALAEAVRNRVDGTTIEFPNGAFIDSVRDTVEESEGARPGRLFGKYIDVMIWCKQDDPTFA